MAVTLAPAALERIRGYLTAAPGTLGLRFDVKQGRGIPDWYFKLPREFGANSTFRMQWQQRFSQAFIATVFRMAGGGYPGIKLAIVSAFGFFAYSVQFPVGRLPFLLAALVLGAATFCALGIAISGFIPNADAAPAVVNLTILPLLFVSNVFIQVGPSFPT